MDVRLKRYQAEDAAALFEAVRASAAALSPWMPWCTPEYSLRDAELWVQAQSAAFLDGTAHEFAIIDPQGRFVGGCGINRLDALNRVANLGYWVRSDEHGKGIATAAATLATGWAFEHTDIVRLDVLVAAANGASLRVAEKIGARREGILRSRLYLHGKSHDAVLLSVVRGDRDGTSGGPSL